MICHEGRLLRVFDVIVFQSTGVWGRAVSNCLPMLVTGERYFLLNEPLFGSTLTLKSYHHCIFDTNSLSGRLFINILIYFTAAMCVHMYRDDPSRAA